MSRTVKGKGAAKKKEAPEIPPPSAESAPTAFDPDSDEALVLRIQGGDAEVCNVLVERYTGYVEAIARKYFIAGSEHEDVLQEAFIGFYEAVKSYKPTNLSFKQFAYYCVQKNIYDAIQSTKRLKRQPQGEVISLEASIYPESDQDDRIRVIDQIVNQKYINPEDLVILKSMVKDVVILLSGFEREVLRGHLMGKSYEEICAESRKSGKAVGNALQRARDKIKRYFMREIRK